VCFVRYRCLTGHYHRDKKLPVSLCVFVRRFTQPDVLFITHDPANWQPQAWQLKGVCWELLGARPARAESTVWLVEDLRGLLAASWTGYRPFECHL
jgi:hypothetical protein